MQWGGSEILACRMQVVRDLRRLQVTLFPLDIVEKLFISVNQKHVFHDGASARPWPSVFAEVVPLRCLVLARDSDREARYWPRGSRSCCGPASPGTERRPKKWLLTVRFRVNRSCAEPLRRGPHGAGLATGDLASPRHARSESPRAVPLSCGIRWRLWSPCGRKIRCRFARVARPRSR